MVQYGDIIATISSAGLVQPPYTLRQSRNVDSYMAIYAEEAIHEFPFAPPNGVGRLEGRSAIYAYMRRLPSMISFGSLDDVQVREAGDELFVEATGRHLSVSDGSPRSLRYIWFITVRDGKVLHFRDYVHPL